MSESVLENLARAMIVPLGYSKDCQWEKIFVGNDMDINVDNSLRALCYELANNAILLINAAEKAAFDHGYLIATANIQHLHGEEVIAADVLRELGISRAEFEDLGLCEYDHDVISPLYDNIEARDAYDAWRKEN